MELSAVGGLPSSWFKRVKAGWKVVMVMPRCRTAVNRCFKYHYHQAVSSIFDSELVNESGVLRRRV
jgi:hypothetical protein